MNIWKLPVHANFLNFCNFLLLKIISPYCVIRPTCRLCCFAWTPRLPLNLNSPTTVRNHFWMSIFFIQLRFHEIFHYQLFSHTCHYLMCFLYISWTRKRWNVGILLQKIFHLICGLLQASLSHFLAHFYLLSHIQITTISLICTWWGG